MSPFKLTYRLEDIVSMEFLVISIRLVIQEKLPMEESREHRIEEVLKLEQKRQESILLTKIVQRR